MPEEKRCHINKDTTLDGIMKQVYSIEKRPRIIGIWRQNWTMWTTEDQKHTYIKQTDKCPWSISLEMGMVWQRELRFGGTLRVKSLELQSGNYRSDLYWFYMTMTMFLSCFLLESSVWRLLRIPLQWWKPLIHYLSLYPTTKTDGCRFIFRGVVVEEHFSQSRCYCQWCLK